MKEKKKMSKTAKIILIAVTVVAALLVIAGLNKPHTSPFKTSVESVYQFDKATSDKGGVIIDEQGKRLLFTDVEGKLVTIVDLTKSGSLINKAFEVKIEGDTARVYGVYKIQDGIYQSSESIVDYTLDGKFIGEEYRQDFAEDEYVTSRQYTIAEIDAANGVISDTAADDEASIFDTTITEEQISRAEVVHYSTWYMIKNIIYWLGVAWIAFILIFLVVKLFSKKPSTKTVTAVIGIACILFTAVFYTIRSYQQLREKYENDVALTTQQMSFFMSDSYGDDVALIRDGINEYGPEYLNEPEAVEIINELQYTVKTICDLNGNPDVGGLQVLVRDNEGITYTLADSRGIIPSGARIKLGEDALAIIDNHDSQNVLYVSGTGADVITDFDHIYDSEGNSVGVVDAFKYEDNLIATQSQMGVDTFFTLLAIFIGLYMVASCIMVFSADLKRRKTREKSDLGGRASDMAGIYMFAFKLTSTIDEVIIVYVASSLCVGMDPALEAVLVALPLTLYGIGRWVGTFLATPFIKKFGERATGVINCLLGVGTAAVMILSIQTGNIYLYAIGKGLWGFSLSGALFVISDTLPLSASNDKEKSLAKDSSQQSSSAAGILTALLSGYISQYMGYSTVYLTGAIMAGLLLLLTLMTFGKKKPAAETAVTEKTDRDKGSYMQYWTIFLKPEMLMYLAFYVVPTILTGGYSTYLFPLYSAGAGISVVLLSNINVFSKALMYVTNKPLRELTKGLNRTVLMTLPMLATCVGLLCFVISPNIYWAIIMLFAGAVFSRMTSVSAMMYRVKTAEQYNLDSKLVTSNYYTVQSALNIFQSPILSAFMLLGSNAACAAVGGVCGILFTIFAGYNRKHNAKVKA